VILHIPLEGGQVHYPFRRILEGLNDTGISVADDIGMVEKERCHSMPTKVAPGQGIHVLLLKNSTNSSHYSINSRRSSLIIQIKFGFLGMHQIS
jgi:hypothetical protein